MPLNLTSRLQVTAHHFWNRRNAAALSHHGVRLEYDPEQRRSAALILGFTFTILAVALMFILSWFKPAGQVGSSAILADRDTGAIYVLVDGRLHPALNLISARLVAGEAKNPTFVKADELAKYPSGPTVGIVGAPAAMPIRVAGTGGHLDRLGGQGAGGDRDRGCAHRGAALRAAADARRDSGQPPRQDLCHLGRAPLRDRPVQQGGGAGPGGGFVGSGAGPAVQRAV
jgi:hypothetical protein